MRAATREAFALYGRYWYETFALRTMSSEDVNRLFRSTGVEHIDAGLSAGRGVIVALPHMGNWDAAGHWLAVNGYPVVAVAEELRPASVYDLFYRHRRALGMQIVPLQSGVGRAADPPAVARTGSSRCSATATSAAAACRSTSSASRRRCRPARRCLRRRPARRCSRPWSTPQDQGWTCTRGAADWTSEAGGRGADGVRATMTELAGDFERCISAAPADWHMFQPVWEADLADRGAASKKGGTRVAA